MNAEKITLLQITDTHLFAKPDGKLLGLNTFDSMLQVLEMVRDSSHTPDIVVLTGDLSQDGSAESYATLVEQLAFLQCPIYWIAGNHDDIAVMNEVLNPSHLLPEKEVQLPNWEIILLNTADPGRVSGYLNELELHRLDACLEKSKRENTLIFMHHQPININCQWLEPIGLSNAVDLYKTIKGHQHIRAICCGHIHQAFELEKDDIHYMSCPSTCIQFKPQASDFALDKVAPGVRWMELYADGRIHSWVDRVNNFDIAVLDESIKGY